MRPATPIGFGPRAPSLRLLPRQHADQPRHDADDQRAEDRCTRTTHREARHQRRRERRRPARSPPNRTGPASGSSAAASRSPAPGRTSALTRPSTRAASASVCRRRPATPGTMDAVTHSATATINQCTRKLISRSLDRSGLAMAPLDGSRRAERRAAAGDQLSRVQSSAGSPAANTALMRYSASMASCQRASTTLRRTFSVGVSSPPSIVNSAGSSADPLQLLELRQLAVERVDHLLIEPNDVGAPHQLLARRHRHAPAPCRRSASTREVRHDEHRRKAAPIADDDRLGDERARLQPRLRSAAAPPSCRPR